MATQELAPAVVALHSAVTTPRGHMRLCASVIDLDRFVNTLPPVANVVPRSLRRFGVMVVALTLAGCAATLPERLIVPEELASIAQIEGMSDVDVWGDNAKAASARFIANEAPTLRNKLLESRRRGVAPSSAARDTTDMYA